MQPTNVEILRSCVANLEELVTPNLQDRHARSAALCIRTLLNHVALRLEKEDEHLQQDSLEKRELLRTVGARLLREDKAALQALGTDIERRILEVPAISRRASTDELTVENDALRRIVIEMLKALHAEGDATPEPVVADLNRLIRTQLRAEAVRDAALVLIDGPLF